MTAMSYRPRTGASVPAPPDSTPAEVDRAVAAAAAAAPRVAASSLTERAAWLAAIAATMHANADELCRIADEETGLGLDRLQGELARTASALLFYGSVATEGSWLDATIDSASDGRPDLRRLNRPLGPVAIFGASNFPFGFGILGHDTASALATGCPVVLKAHPGHPLLCQALAELAATSLRDSGAPDGTFGIVSGFDAGTRLVMHPDTAAVAFTGSPSGGLALWRLAATRDRVIPVYAEMGTVNSAVVTRRGAKERMPGIAAGFVASFTLGLGQFCTKPGLLLAPAGADSVARVADALLASAPKGWLLTAGIAHAYEQGIERLIAAGAEVALRTEAAATGWGAAPTVLRVAADLLHPDSPLLTECFGPVGIVVEYESDTERNRVLDALPGSLAAAVHGALADDPQVAELVDRLAARAGRVVVNGWPTGVAVTWAQQHGGPWPATSNPSASSVGAAALGRFVRPVAYQDAPEQALPPSLQDSNPWQIPRRVNGQFQP